MIYRSGFVILPLQAFEAQIGMGVQGLPFREIPTTLNPLPLNIISAICMPSLSNPSFLVNLGG